MKTLTQIILWLLIPCIALTASVHADDTIPFSGVVLTVEGKRMEIELQDGSRLWGTVDSSVPADAVGQQVTGSYSPLGDINRIVSPIFKPTDR